MSTSTSPTDRAVSNEQDAFGVSPSQKRPSNTISPTPSNPTPSNGGGGSSSAVVSDRQRRRLAMLSALAAAKLKDSDSDSSEGSSERNRRKAAVTVAPPPPAPQPQQEPLPTTAASMMLSSTTAAQQQVTTVTSRVKQEEQQQSSVQKTVSAASGSEVIMSVTTHVEVKREETTTSSSDLKTLITTVAPPPSLPPLLPSQSSSSSTTTTASAAPPPPRARSRSGTPTRITTTDIVHTTDPTTGAVVATTLAPQSQNQNQQQQQIRPQQRSSSPHPQPPLSGPATDNGATTTTTAVSPSAPPVVLASDNVSQSVTTVLPRHAAAAEGPSASRNRDDQVTAPPPPPPLTSLPKLPIGRPPPEASAAVGVGGGELPARPAPVPPPSHHHLHASTATVTTVGPPPRAGGGGGPLAPSSSASSHQHPSSTSAHAAFPSNPPPPPPPSAADSVTASSSKTTANSKLSSTQQIPSGLKVPPASSNNNSRRHSATTSATSDEDMHKYDADDATSIGANNNIMNGNDGGYVYDAGYEYVAPSADTVKDKKMEERRTTTPQPPMRVPSPRNSTALTPTASGINRPPLPPMTPRSRATTPRAAAGEREVGEKGNDTTPSSRHQREELADDYVVVIRSAKRAPEDIPYPIPSGRPSRSNSANSGRHPELMPTPRSRYGREASSRESSAINRSINIGGSDAKDRHGVVDQHSLLAVEPSPSSTVQANEAKEKEDDQMKEKKRAEEEAVPEVIHTVETVHDRPVPTPPSSPPSPSIVRANTDTTHGGAEGEEVAEASVLLRSRIEALDALSDKEGEEEDEAALLESDSEFEVVWEEVTDDEDCTSNTSSDDDNDDDGAVSKVTVGGAGDRSRVRFASDNTTATMATTPGRAYDASSYVVVSPNTTAGGALTLLSGISGATAGGEVSVANTAANIENGGDGGENNAKNTNKMMKYMGRGGASDAKPYEAQTMRTLIAINEDAKLARREERRRRRLGIIAEERSADKNNTIHPSPPPSTSSSRRAKREAQRAQLLAKLGRFAGAAERQWLEEYKARAEARKERRAREAAERQRRNREEGDGNNKSKRRNQFAEPIKTRDMVTGGQLIVTPLAPDPAHGIVDAKEKGAANLVEVSAMTENGLVVDRVPEEGVWALRRQMAAQLAKRDEGLKSVHEAKRRLASLQREVAREVKPFQQHHNHSILNGSSLLSCTRRRQQQHQFKTKQGEASANNGNGNTDNNSPNEINAIGGARGNATTTSRSASSAAASSTFVIMAGTSSSSLSPSATSIRSVSTEGIRFVQLDGNDSPAAADKKKAPNGEDEKGVPSSYFDPTSSFLPAVGSVLEAFIGGHAQRTIAAKIPSLASRTVSPSSRQEQTPAIPMPRRISAHLPCPQVTMRPTTALMTYAADNGGASHARPKRTRWVKRRVRRIVDGEQQQHKGANPAVGSVAAMAGALFGDPRLSACYYLPSVTTAPTSVTDNAKPPATTNNNVGALGSVASSSITFVPTGASAATTMLSPYYFVSVTTLNDVQPMPSISPSTTGATSTAVATIASPLGAAEGVGGAMMFNRNMIQSRKEKRADERFKINFNLLAPLNASDKTRRRRDDDESDEVSDGDSEADENDEDTTAYRRTALRVVVEWSQRDVLAAAAAAQHRVRGGLDGQQLPPPPLDEVLAEQQRHFSFFSSSFPMPYLLEIHASKKKKKRASNKSDGTKTTTTASSAAAINNNVADFTLYLFPNSTASSHTNPSSLRGGAAALVPKAPPSLVVPLSSQTIAGLRLCPRRPQQSLILDLRLRASVASTTTDTPLPSHVKTPQQCSDNCVSLKISLLHSPTLEGGQSASLLLSLLATLAAAKLCKGISNTATATATDNDIKKLPAEESAADGPIRLSLPLPSIVPPLQLVASVTEQQQQTSSSSSSSLPTDLQRAAALQTSAIVHWYTQLLRPMLPSNVAPFSSSTPLPPLLQPIVPERLANGNNAAPTAPLLKILDPHGDGSSVLCPDVCGVVKTMAARAPLSNKGSSNQLNQQQCCQYDLRCLDAGAARLVCHPLLNLDVNDTTSLRDVESATDAATVFDNNAAISSTRNKKEGGVVSPADVMYLLKLPNTSGIEALAALFTAAATTEATSPSAHNEGGGGGGGGSLKGVNSKPTPLLPAELMDSPDILSLADSASEREISDVSDHDFDDDDDDDTTSTTSSPSPSAIGADEQTRKTEDDTTTTASIRFQLTNRSGDDDGSLFEFNPEMNTTDSDNDADEVSPESSSSSTASINITRISPSKDATEESPNRDDSRPSGGGLVVGDGDLIIAATTKSSKRHMFAMADEDDLEEERARREREEAEAKAAEAAAKEAERLRREELRRAEAERKKREKAAKAEAAARRKREEEERKRREEDKMRRALAKAERQKEREARRAERKAAKAMLKAYELSEKEAARKTLFEAKVRSREQASQQRRAQRRREVEEKRRAQRRRRAERALRREAFDRQQLEGMMVAARKHTCERVVKRIVLESYGCGAAGGEATGKGQQCHPALATNLLLNPIATVPSQQHHQQSQQHISSSSIASFSTASFTLAANHVKRVTFGVPFLHTVHDISLLPATSSSGGGGGDATAPFTTTGSMLIAMEPCISRLAALPSSSTASSKSAPPKPTNDATMCTFGGFIKRYLASPLPLPPISSSSDGGDSGEAPSPSPLNNGSSSSLCFIVPIRRQLVGIVAAQLIAAVGMIHARGMLAAGLGPRRLMLNMKTEVSYTYSEGRQAEEKIKKDEKASDESRPPQPSSSSVMSLAIGIVPKLSLFGVGILSDSADYNLTTHASGGDNDGFGNDASKAAAVGNLRNATFGPHAAAFSHNAAADAILAAGAGSVGKTRHQQQKSLKRLDGDSLTTISSVSVGGSSWQQQQSGVGNYLSPKLRGFLASSSSSASPVADVFDDWFAVGLMLFDMVTALPPPLPLAAGTSMGAASPLFTSLHAACSGAVFWEKEVMEPYRRMRALSSSTYSFAGASSSAPGNINTAATPPFVSLGQQDTNAFHYYVVRRLDLVAMAAAAGVGGGEAYAHFTTPDTLFMLQEQEAIYSKKWQNSGGGADIPTSPFLLHSWLSCARTSLRSEILRNLLAGKGALEDLEATPSSSSAPHHPHAPIIIDDCLAHLLFTLLVADPYAATEGLLRRGAAAVSSNTTTANKKATTSGDVEKQSRCVPKPLTAFALLAHPAFTVRPPLMIMMSEEEEGATHDNKDNNAGDGGHHWWKSPSAFAVSPIAASFVNSAVAAQTAKPFGNSTNTAANNGRGSAMGGAAIDPASTSMLSALVKRSLVAPAVDIMCPMEPLVVGGGDAATSTTTKDKSEANQQSAAPLLLSPSSSRKAHQQQQHQQEQQERALRAMEEAMDRMPSFERDPSLLLPWWAGAASALAHAGDKKEARNTNTGISSRSSSRGVSPTTTALVVRSSSKQRSSSASSQQQQQQQYVRTLSSNGGRCVTPRSSRDAPPNHHHSSHKQHAHHPRSSSAVRTASPLLHARSSTTTPMPTPRGGPTKPFSRHGSGLPKAQPSPSSSSASAVNGAKKVDGQNCGPSPSSFATLFPPPAPLKARSLATAVVSPPLKKKNDDTDEKVNTTNKSRSRVELAMSDLIMPFYVTSASSAAEGISLMRLYTAALEEAEAHLKRKEEKKDVGTRNHFFRHASAPPNSNNQSSPSAAGGGSVGSGGSSNVSPVTINNDNNGMSAAIRQNQEHHDSEERQLLLQFKRFVATTEANKKNGAGKPLPLARTVSPTTFDYLRRHTKATAAKQSIDNAANGTANGGGADGEESEKKKKHDGNISHYLKVAHMIAEEEAVVGEGGGGAISSSNQQHHVLSSNAAGIIELRNQRAVPDFSRPSTTRDTAAAATTPTSNQRNTSSAKKSSPSPLSSSALKFLTAKERQALEKDFPHLSLMERQEKHHLIMAQFHKQSYAAAQDLLTAANGLSNASTSVQAAPSPSSNAASLTSPRTNKDNGEVDAPPRPPLPGISPSSVAASARTAASSSVNLNVKPRYNDPTYTSPIISKRKSEGEYFKERREREAAEKAMDWGKLAELDKKYRVRQEEQLMASASSIAEKQEATETYRDKHVPDQFGRAPDLPKEHVPKFMRPTIEAEARMRALAALEEEMKKPQSLTSDNLKKFTESTTPPTTSPPPLGGSARKQGGVGVSGTQSTSSEPAAESSSNALLPEEVVRRAAAAAAASVSRKKSSSAADNRSGSSSKQNKKERSPSSSMTTMTTSSSSSSSSTSSSSSSLDTTTTTIASSASSLSDLPAERGGGRGDENALLEVTGRDNDESQPTRGEGGGGSDSPSPFRVVEAHHGAVSAVQHIDRNDDNDDDGDADKKNHTRGDVEHIAEQKTQQQQPSFVQQQQPFVTSFGESEVPRSDEVIPKPTAIAGLARTVDDMAVNGTTTTATTITSLTTTAAGGDGEGEEASPPTTDNNEPTSTRSSSISSSSSSSSEETTATTLTTTVTTTTTQTTTVTSSSAAVAVAGKWVIARDEDDLI